MYDRKHAIVAADMLNDRVIPFYDDYGVRLLRILTDRGTEYCGVRDHHEFELYLALEDIDHTRTKARSPQTNGICERLNRTIQDEFYSIAFRKSFIAPWKRYKKTWTNGLIIIIVIGHILVSTASDARLYKHLKKPYL